MTIQLYCFGESGNAYKAALTLELSGLEWEPVFVDFFNGEGRSPEFRAINSMGEVPVMVDGDLTLSRDVYEAVADITERLGADKADNVPFEKYANAANGLLKPSSAARAIDGGSDAIERVDMLVKLIADQMGITIPVVDEVVRVVNARLKANSRAAA
jgi:hypothetical protein